MEAIEARLAELAELEMPYSPNAGHFWEAVSKKTVLETSSGSRMVSREDLIWHFYLHN